LVGERTGVSVCGMCDRAAVPALSIRGRQVRPPASPGGAPARSPPLLSSPASASLAEGRMPSRSVDDRLPVVGLGYLPSYVLFSAFPRRCWRRMWRSGRSMCTVSFDRIGMVELGGLGMVRRPRGPVRSRRIGRWRSMRIRGQGGGQGWQWRLIRISGGVGRHWWWGMGRWWE